MTEQVRQCAGCDRADGDPVWCGPCRRSLRTALTEINRLTLWLEAESDGYRSRPDGPTTGRTGRLPDLAPTIDMIDAVYGELCEMEDMWRRGLGLPMSMRCQFGRGTGPRTAVLAFLQSKLDVMAKVDHEKVIHGLNRVVHWRIVLQHAAHSEPERKTKPGRCPNCHYVNTLVYDPAIELIKCGDCHAVITEAEYEDHIVARPDAAVVVETRKALGLG